MNNTVQQQIESEYQNYCASDPNVEKYYMLPNGHKFFILEIESVNENLLKLTGIMKKNSDEEGSEGQMIIHVSQINIIFERF